MIMEIMVLYLTLTGGAHRTEPLNNFLFIMLSTLICDMLLFVAFFVHSFHFLPFFFKGIYKSKFKMKSSKELSWTLTEEAGLLYLRMSNKNKNDWKIEKVRLLVKGRQICEGNIFKGICSLPSWVMSCYLEKVKLLEEKI